MTDYGHDLRFGTFITPGNAQPETPVTLAQLSEQLGFDLVTFQDHPYQPGFLDTWTLLSWVAARTSTIHLSGNVLNLPLRPPAVLARAAASLDLLSGGRFELGLGAGGFWDAVGAMGGRKLTPGQGSTPSRRRSMSSEASGMSLTVRCCGCRASTTNWTARSADRRRRMTSRSGSGR